MSITRCFTVLCLLFSAQVFAQSKANESFFRNPLDIPIYLAGNFGECRPGHFHSGIDIKTKGEENLMVYAAADGYISRIKMEKGGFGHAIYITHPNGLTTLYAHLNDFMPSLQAYIRQQQYAKQSWELDITLTPSQFPVKKGNFIAYSGNTGASTAPHLHFEIRHSKTEHPLNPQLYGFPMQDTKPPVPVELSVYTQPFYARIPTFHSLKFNKGIYTTGVSGKKGKVVVKDTLVVTEPRVGLGINVDDYMDGSDNSLSYLDIKLFLNDSLQTHIVLDDIGYDETRYVNAFADYRTKKKVGRWQQCLFKLPGNNLNSIYRDLNVNSGWLDLELNKVYQVRIRIEDDMKNVSTVTTKLVYRLSGSKTTITPIGQLWSWNKPNFIKDANLSFSLDKGALYDDIFFNFSASEKKKSFSYTYQLGDPAIPIHKYSDLKIRPYKPVPFDLRNKMVLISSDGKSIEGKAAKSIEEGWYSASVRSFGEYWLDVDTVAPKITCNVKEDANLSSAKKIAFFAKDDITSVKKFSGFIDEQWVCFEQRGNMFFYEFDEYCKPGEHQLVFVAQDENGNSNSFTLHFTR